ncbi:MAG: FAD-dependent oxidoreductase [Pseudomonadales bacterium]|nr:FAD-dependent oxidoreductase [Pseudomonadales bacterium]
MSLSRWIVLILVLSLIGAFIYFDLGAYLTLENIKTEQERLSNLLAQYPWQFSLSFFAMYVAVTALSIPGAAAMTLVAGAIFGFWWGLLLVSFASSIGATLAMVLARWLFKAQVEQKFRRQLETINRGIEKEGAFYLFTLRLVPIFPFFAINLAMALTKMRVLVFYLVSQLGMLAGTVVYVNAGTQLGQLASLSGILSPELLGSFVLLGVFPLMAKWFVDWIKAQRVYSSYKKPSSFDRDMVVIGAGSGGLVAALIAATVKAKVTLIEKNKMGGDCLNTGCVPSKALLRSARHAYDNRRGEQLGFTDQELAVDFKDIMARVQRAIAEIEPHDSVERYEGLGVDVEEGYGEIVSPWHVKVNGKTLSTRNIVIASGAEPFVPPVKGIDQIEYLTSDNLWQLDERPERLVVLGGGPIGTELTQAFSRLGSNVTQVELLPNIIPREDQEFSAMVQTQLELEGVNVLTGHRAEEVIVDGGENKLKVVDGNGNEKMVPFDRLLVAVGRRANTSGFGLEELGIELNANGTVAVDDYLRTNYPNIYAIGDAAGPYQFTHTASHMAWYASVNALFGMFRKFKVDYRVIPWATFCSPEVARVGLNEMEAKEQGIDYDVATYDVGDLDRAIADEEAHGRVKVLTEKGKDKVIGVTIAAEHAGDLISEYVLAMKHGIGLNKILGTIHIYPTMAEMNKFVASEWRKDNKPEWALDIAEKFHTWRRGA